MGENRKSLTIFSYSDIVFDYFRQPSFDFQEGDLEANKMLSVTFQRLVYTVTRIT